MQKVLKLAYYSAKLVSNSISNGEETIRAKSSVNFFHLKAMYMTFCVLG